MPFAPDFDGAVAWINSKPLKINDLRGKVVMVDFWTYSCVNCIRTMPHLISTYEKYKKLGFVLIGAHTPEFDFEGKVENVKAAVKKFKITYPVAVDSNMAIWHAYNNHYWPAQYLIDAKGKIVWTHAGEGGYEEIEKHIREELAKTGAVLPPLKPGKEQKAGLLQRFRTTPETYLGSSRAEGFGSNKVCIKGGCDRHIDEAKEHTGDVVYLSGDWKQEPEYIEHIGKEGYILQKYTAKEVNIVMEPVKGTCTAKILLDGKPLKTLKVNGPWMYNLANTKQTETHEIKIVTKGKLRAFAFTYG